MGARPSNFENLYFLIEIHCTSMYICLLPQNQLLYQTFAIITMQVVHIEIHTPSLIRNEKGLVLEPGPELRQFLLSYENTLYIDAYLSVAPKPALLSAIPYHYNAPRPYSNTH